MVQVLVLAVARWLVTVSCGSVSVSRFLKC